MPDPPKPWPWPENRLERRTRIANLYRDALSEAAPHACHELDATLDDYGQSWITGNRPPLNPDEPMTATEIGRWIDSSSQSVTNRITTRNIKPVGRRNGRKTYNLADFTSNPPPQIADKTNDTVVRCTPS